MENGSSEKKTDLTKFQMTKIAFYDFTFFFLSFFPTYITLHLFATVETLHPQACYISLVYKNMTVRRHQNCVLVLETGKD